MAGRACYPDSSRPWPATAGVDALLAAVSDYVFGRWGTLCEVVTCVSSGVVLVSIAAGVEQKIDSLVSDPRIARTHLLNVGLIHSILTSLTVAVLLGVLANLAVSAFVLGQLVMRSRREEIAVRKDTGASAALLLMEYVREATAWAVLGGIAGQVIGIAIASMIDHWSPLPAVLTLPSWWAIWPTAAVTVVAANFLPAFAAARMSAEEFFSRK